MNHDVAEEAPRDGIAEPPRSLGGTLLKLGPGMIIAGSIVGSGELIATTKVGAEAGFWLLWLILLGCVIKVFAQVEFGRHAITWGQTPLRAMDELPGPRWRVNWLVWYWALATVLVVAQQGGIVGGVGQTLAISVPLTERGVAYNSAHDALTRARVELALTARTQGDPAGLQARIDSLAAVAEPLAEPPDAYLWATIIAISTAVMLYFGRYGLIQAVSTVLVMAFTAVTVITAFGIQQTAWAMSPGELADGMSFRLPPVVAGADPVTTALAAFGIIGIGAIELVMYPYWCLEKGYARYTGPRDGSVGWTRRARGWVRVLHVDAWLSMAIYTFATLAFYVLGASVLWRIGLNPAGNTMIRTLAETYVPVFGRWAQGVFLVGAFAVLYSTFFVAAAGNARIVADGLGLFGAHDGSEAARVRWTRWLSVLWPLTALLILLFVRAPVALVLAGGLAQSLMLPLLGVAVLFFRYRRLDDDLRPGRLWDAFLWLSVAGFFLVAAWALYGTLAS